jgi:hypothetical protein
MHVKLFFDTNHSAHHEAAHAVVFLLNGIQVDEICLWPDGNGMCSVPKDLPATKGRLLGILAGSEADKLFLSDNPVALHLQKLGWTRDYELAEELLGQMNDGTSLEDATIECAKLVQERQATIHSLAKTIIDLSQECFDAGDKFMMPDYELKSIFDRIQNVATHPPTPPPPSQP